MKTYILERSQDELKNLIKKGSKEILSSLRDAHPKALTSKELIAQTGLAEATVYSSISSLKKENYIKEIGKGKSRPGRPEQNATYIPTMKYILEDGTHSKSKEYHCKLSRGNVQYDAEFIKVSDRLLEKLNLTTLFDQLLLVARDMQSHIKNEEDKDFKKWAPFRGKEFLCPNCKINHELRDFLRAMLLRSLDKFESDERYSSFLTENGYVTGRGTQTSSVLKVGLSLKKPEPKKATDGLVLRILSIGKDTRKGQYELLAIDKSKTWVSAEIDTDLVTDELVPDSMVECFPEYFGVDPELDILYIGLSKKDNHSIKRIPEMGTFPKWRDIITNIGTIIFKSTEGGFFTVEGIITQIKALNSDEDSRDKLASIVHLRDNTGIIPLKLHSRYSNKFHEGDKILAVGAVVNDLGSLTAGNLSSVIKTGSVIITERNSPYQNEVYNKHLEVNSELVQERIAVTLIDVIISNSGARAILSVENKREKDIKLAASSDDFIAIQNKTQFIGSKLIFNHRYSIIPPGIAQTLIVEFEGLDPTQSIVSFRFSIYLKSGQTYTRQDFMFTVQIPH